MAAFIQICPTCTGGFPSVQLLSEHIEKWHEKKEVKKPVGNVYWFRPKPERILVKITKSDKPPSPCCLETIGYIGRDGIGVNCSCGRVVQPEDVLQNKEEIDAGIVTS